MSIKIFYQKRRSRLEFAYKMETASLDRKHKLEMRRIKLKFFKYKYKMHFYAWKNYIKSIFIIILIFITVVFICYLIKIIKTIFSWLEIFVTAHPTKSAVVIMILCVFFIFFVIWNVQKQYRMAGKFLDIRTVDGKARAGLNAEKHEVIHNSKNIFRFFSIILTSNSAMDSSVKKSFLEKFKAIEALTAQLYEVDNYNADLETFLILLRNNLYRIYDIKIKFMYLGRVFEDKFVRFSRIAIIINELFVNSYKVAQSVSFPPEISLHCTTNDETIELIYQDNLGGYRAGFSIDQSVGGLALVSEIVKNFFSGKISVESSCDGLTYKILLNLYGIQNPFD